MPRLDSEYLTKSPASHPHRRAPRAAPPPPRAALEADPAASIPAERPQRERTEGAGGLLWPAMASFALVFAAGVYVFWLLHPGQQSEAIPTAHGIDLPSAAVVAGWVAALALLPRILPRGLAWLLLIAGTVFVAIVLSREVTAWLQAVLGSLQL